MPVRRKRPCCICRHWFRPDLRVGVRHVLVEKRSAKPHVAARPGPLGGRGIRITLSPAVNPERRRVTVHPSAEEKSAKRQSSQKSSKHSAYGVRSVSIGVGEQAREDGFKDKARSARQKE